MDLREVLTRFQNLKNVLDSLTEAVIAHDVDRRIIFFNKAAERLTGVSHKEALGRDCHEVIQGGFCGDRCTFCTELPTNFEPFSFPLVLTDTRGRAHQVEMVLVPMKDEGGKIVGAVGAARDVTELHELKRRLGEERSFRGIVGQHHRMRDVYELVRQVAETDLPVHIFGESGTGKELVARAVHEESPRAGGPFVAVNCAALPEGLLESELFGHVRGAFTGAVRDKKGRFERAGGGTLFLDEVAELTPSVQAKLLRVLQDRTVEPVGAERSVAVDVRIVSATNRELKSRVARGAFREDLFYRLSVVPIELPPLRDRRTDILLIAQHLLVRFAADLGRPAPPIKEDAAKVLIDHLWPGNVRELDNALKYAAVKSGGGPIHARHLPGDVKAGGDRPTEPGSKKGLIPQEPRGGAWGGPRRGAGRKPSFDPSQVRRALEECGGNRTRAAEFLGISRATLYRLLGKTR